MTDSRKPMTPEEVHELLTVCLHGPLPQNTIYRMMATLAEWSPIVTAAMKRAEKAERERDEALAEVARLEGRVRVLRRWLENLPDDVDLEQAREALSRLDIDKEIETAVSKAPDENGRPEEAKGKVG
jgi:hypothetical protein